MNVVFKLECTACHAVILETTDPYSVRVDLTHRLADEHADRCPARAQHVFVERRVET